MYFEIMAEMARPADFPKAFLISGPIMVSIYLLVACAHIRKVLRGHVIRKVEDLPARRVRTGESPTRKILGCALLPAEQEADSSHLAAGAWATTTSARTRQARWSRTCRPGLPTAPRRLAIAAREVHRPARASAS